MHSSGPRPLIVCSQALARRGHMRASWLCLIVGVAVGCSSPRVASPTLGTAGNVATPAGAPGPVMAAGSGGRGANAAQGGASGLAFAPTAGSGAAGVTASDADAGPGEMGDGAVSQLHGSFSPAQLEMQHCQPARPGFFYRGSQSARPSAEIPPPGMIAPIPCITYTNMGSAESSLGVTSDGSVYYAPVFANDGVGLLTSQDFGANWQVLQPKLSNGATHGRQQPLLYIDPKTDRMFFLTMAGSAPMPASNNGFDLSMSTDRGKTWTSSNLASDTMDWIKLFAGPAISSQTTGYPNVLYASAPSPISTAIPVVSALGVGPQYQAIYRSLDGGTSWARVAMPSLMTQDAPGCAAANEWIIYGAGAVASDGTAYQVLRRCRKLAVAVSGDEGAHWEIQELPGVALPPFDTTNLLQIVANPNLLVTDQLTLDTEGNVYVAYIDADGKLRFSISKDKAQTWSSPVTFSAPEVTDVRYVGLATAKPGTLAAAYYGSTDGVKYNGYLTETTQAFDAEPTFASVTVNDPAQPLYPWGFEVGYLGVVSGSDLNEIVQAKYAPNGDLWGSFVQDMCQSATTTRCTWDAAAHANSPYQGIVGRMVHGVSERWGTTNPVDPDRYKTTCEASATNTQSCRAVADGENICQELGSCACGSCACEMLECEKYPDCKAVRQCATKNNCRGIDCLVPCNGIALEAGDLMTTRALQVADCLTKNSCPASCPAF